VAAALFKPKEETMHNTPEQNEAFRKAWDATNARWKAQTMREDKAPNFASTPAEILDYYDSHLNLTLRELSNMTGKTIPYLKGLLMHPDPVQAAEAAAFTLQHTPNQPPTTSAQTPLF